MGDAPSVATAPDLIKTMKDAGCCYISFGFESASDKVLNQDILKGQLQKHEQLTIDTVKKVGLTPLATFMIGNPHEDINDLMETMDFWIRNEIEVDPFICTPYVGSPLFFNFKNFILEQYDERLKLIKNSDNMNKEIIEKWKLDALDRFMKDCGEASEYTATVSQYFTVAELYAIKHFMYKKDHRRLLKMAHKRYKETRLSHWKHGNKWKKYCEICLAEEEIHPKISTSK